MSEERYKNGKIYTVRYRKDDNLIYVGSTCLPLYKRFYNHKHNCFNENSKDYNKNLYQKIRETNNINDWYIELYEDYPTTTKNLLEKREGEIIREIGTLNKYIAGRTIKEYNKEYKENNKEKIKEYDKKRYETKKEKILEQQKEYNKIKIICPCGCEVLKKQLKRHQQSNKHKQFLQEREQEFNIIN